MNIVPIIIESIKGISAYLQLRLFAKKEKKQNIKTQKKKLEEAIESKNTARIINRFIRIKRM